MIAKIGRMPTVKMTMQVPEPIARALRSKARQIEGPGVQMLATAASALIVGMPESVRRRLLREVYATTAHRGSDAIEPEEIWSALLDELSQQEGQVVAGRVDPALRSWLAEAVRRVPPPAGARPGPEGLSDEELAATILTRILDPRLLAPASAIVHKPARPKRAAE